MIIRYHFSLFFMLLLIKHNFFHVKIIKLLLMDLKQILSDLFHVDQDNFIICTGTTYKSVIKQSTRSTQALQILQKIINTLGQLSATSQGLKQVITNITRFSGTNQRIYIKVKGTIALGFIKTGEKNLFYRDSTGLVKQLQPTCILDFYVHESSQRSGFGKEIFQKFLSFEQISPDKLGYDRPSSKFLSFLKKYYSLTDYLPQNNNFVIFSKFFVSGNNKHYFQTQKDQNHYFYMTSRKSSSSSFSKQNTINNLNENSKSGNQTYKNQVQKQINFRQQEDEHKIMDSLQVFTKQVEDNKKKNPNISSRKQIQLKPFEPFKSQKSINPIKNYHMQSNFHTQPFSQTMPTQEQNMSSQRYSLNKKIKDLSFNVPWAISGQNISQNIVDRRTSFRTTSNIYGIHYQKN